MRPEGPEVNRPGRQAGMRLQRAMSAEGVALSQNRIAGQIQSDGGEAVQAVLPESYVSDGAHVDCEYIQ